MKRKKKSKYLIIPIILLTLILIISLVITFIKKADEDLKLLENLVYENIDLSKIPDGSYSGSFTTIMVAADVVVTVHDNKITGIELVKHKNGKGDPAESIIESIIDYQTLKVDVITGATYSSKVILKAIENALTK